jgi:hypothetical protein
VLLANSDVLPADNDVLPADNDVLPADNEVKTPKNTQHLGVNNQISVNNQIGVDNQISQRASFSNSTCRCYGCQLLPTSNRHQSRSAL